ncbi:MAG: MBL fold metallo-hydrolase [Parvibaculum sp.]
MSEIKKPRGRAAKAAAPGKPWHHLPDGSFRNPPGCPSRGQGRLKYAAPFFVEMLRQGARKVDVPEGHVVPAMEAAAGLASHMAGTGDFLTWLGHACFLLRQSGVTILTDPYLSDNAGPGALGPKRFVEPGIALHALPPVDVLIVSHNHYDHLDERALAALPGKARMTVIVPLRLAAFFRQRGFVHVIELDWYEHHDIRGLRFTALPVVHWSRRTGLDTNKTLWAGFSIRSAAHHTFFGGDSGYGPVFEQLGRDYGPFDTALLGIGAYAPRKMMKASHATPEEAIQMSLDLRARRAVGMHWGTVLLTVEPPFEPPVRFRQAGRDKGLSDEDVWIMRIGETRPLPPASSWPANA